jgi:uncharacterized protein with PQ loop repeat
VIVAPTPIENVLIVIGESFWVFSAAAQLRRLLKTRNTKGLSAPSLTLNAAGNMGWCTYFALNHLWYPFVTNIFVITLTVIILGFTLSNRRQFSRGLVTIAVVGPLTSYLLLCFPGAAGWVGMSYNWLAATPMLIRIVRRRKVSGLSEKSLYFILGAILFTLSYGLLIHSWPLIVGCAQGIVYESIIVRFYYLHRHTD